MARKSILALIALLAISLASACEREGDRPVVPQGTVQAPINVDKQADFLRGVVRDDPQNAQAWTKLGNVLMDSQRFAEAVEAYGKVIELEPENVNVIVDRGTCYRRMGRPDVAAEHFRDAIEIDPSHPLAHRNLGVVMAFDLGDPKTAREEFEKYLEISPAAPDRADVEKLISELKQAEGGATP
ncbi:MAG: tetratricopeptide repeat protein [Nitrospirota bacterium]|jgi:cytochrome c-type biogenesis protein CcmH/NrfG